MERRYSRRARVCVVLSISQLLVSLGLTQAVRILVRGNPGSVLLTQAHTHTHTLN